MAYLTVDQAREGMVLAAPVTDRRGRLLLPEGRPLTERHVEALRMWGISHVEVEGDDPVDEADPTVDPETLDQAREIVDARFGNQKGAHTLLDLLHEQAVAREARRLAAEEVVL